MRPAVFLDRDDTLIANGELALPHAGDLLDPALVRLLPGVAHACRDLKRAGYLLIVVSNQGGIARGHGSIADVEACNARMRELLLAEGGVDLDAVYYCPFHPKGTVPEYTREHPWRKPAPGMFLEAARDHSIDLQSSWMIGDAPRDIDAALAAGISANHALLVGTPQFPHVAAAAATILANL